MYTHQIHMIIPFTDLIYYPNELEDVYLVKPELKQIIIPPAKTVIIPKANVDFDWVVSGADFWCETQVLLSTAPFTQTLKALEEGKHSTADRQRISPLLNPLEVAQALLEDLNQASNTKDEIQNQSSDYS